MTAIRALAFLAEDERRMGRFLALTGLTPEALRNDAADCDWQSAVLDHLMADESLLMVFCGHAGLEPQTVAAARELIDGRPGA